MLLLLLACSKSSAFISNSQRQTDEKEPPNFPTNENGEFIVDTKALPVIEDFVPYHRIPNPDPNKDGLVNIRNPEEKAYIKEVEKSDRLEAAESGSSNMNFYVYRVAKIDMERKDIKDFHDLWSKTRRMDTIATVNQIESPDVEITAGKKFLLPTVDGLFIKKGKASSGYEIILQKECAPFISKETKVFIIDGTAFYFIPGGRFSPTQRAYFLDTNMIMPLSSSVLTSSFGYRVSPISGAWKFHKGVDLAAKVGTPVFACKGGKVSSILKNDPIYGNCLILSHSGGMTSVYAHLSEILVSKEGEQIKGGQTIGKVGVTGATTGPHLHFEIRQNGSAQDPSSYLRLK